MKLQTDTCLYTVQPWTQNQMLVGCLNGTETNVLVGIVNQH